MLRNLLDNAIKYCPQGTLVRVILQPRKILIEDNGGGVTPEELAKLGQRFYRPAGQNEKGKWAWIVYCGKNSRIASLSFPIRKY